MDTDQEKNYQEEWCGLKGKKVESEKSWEQPKVKLWNVRSLTIFFILIIVILFGYFWSLQYSLSPLDLSEQEQEQIAEQKESWDRIGQSLKNIKEGVGAIMTYDESDPAQHLDTELLKQNLLNKTVEDWTVYTNFDQGFSIKFPSDWQQTSKDDNIVFSKDNEDITITIQADIPRPALTEEYIDDFTLGGLEAKLYHDGSAKDGALVDKVIIDLVDSNDDIYIAGYGNVFDMMILTFKFIK